MKGLKRLFLVCMLMICVVFSLTACDKSSNTNDIKVDNEVHAEESAEDKEKKNIEYWLEKGTKNTNNLKKYHIAESPSDLFGYENKEKYFPDSDHGGEGAYKPGMVWSSCTIQAHLFYSKIPEKKRLGFLDVYLPKKIQSYYTVPSFFSWIDVDLDLDIYVFKNGVFFKHKKIKKRSLDTGRFSFNLGFEDICKERDALFVIKHHSFKVRGAQYHGRGHWIYPTNKSGETLQGAVFAFQIGNDDFCDNFKG